MKLREVIGYALGPRSCETRDPARTLHLLCRKTNIYLSKSDFPAFSIECLSNYFHLKQHPQFFLSLCIAQSICCPKPPNFLRILNTIFQLKFIYLLLESVSPLSSTFFPFSLVIPRQNPVREYTCFMTVTWALKLGSRGKRLTTLPLSPEAQYILASILGNCPVT